MTDLQSRSESRQWELLTIPEILKPSKLYAIVSFNENEIAILGQANITQRKVCLYDTTKTKDCWRTISCQWNDSASYHRNYSMNHNGG